MEKTNVSSDLAVATGSKDFKQNLREQMSVDLQVLLSPYKNKDIGLRLISEKTEISEKTLKRVLKGESDPHSVTVQRLYELFFKVVTEESKLNLTHQKIKQEIEQDLSHKKVQIAQSLEKLITTNKVFRDLFLISRTGPICRSWVVEQYGLYGMEMVAIMLKEDLLVESERNVFVQGPFNFSKGSNTLKSIILELVENHMRTDSLQEYGQNSAYYLVEGVTESVYLKILELTDDYKNSIANLMFKPESKGDCRLFITGVIDLFQVQSKKGKLN